MVRKEKGKKIFIPLKAMPEVATTQVWMTVFSCLVKGCFNNPDFSINLVHDFRKKNPNKPAETFREGIIPVVKLSFITMKVKSTPNTKLTTKALIVSCSLQEGSTCPLNIISTDGNLSSESRRRPPSPWSSSSIVIVLLAGFSSTEKVPLSWLSPWKLLSPLRVTMVLERRVWRMMIRIWVCVYNL